LGFTSLREPFLADSTNGRAYETGLRLSVCRLYTEGIVHG